MSGILLVEVIGSGSSDNAEEAASEHSIDWVPRVTAYQCLPTDAWQRAEPSTSLSRCARRGVCMLSLRHASGLLGLVWPIGIHFTVLDSFFYLRWRLRKVDSHNRQLSYVVIFGQTRSMVLIMHTCIDLYTL